MIMCITMQRSTATKRGYDSDLRQFNLWLDGRKPDAESICEYLRDRHPELSALTLERHLSAIKWQFNSSGEGSPTDHPQVIQAKREIARRDRYRPRRLSETIDYGLMLDLVAAVEGHSNTMKRLRDKAVLLVGWWGRLERCALVALDVGDVRPTSKTEVRIMRHRGRQLPGVVYVRRDGKLDLWDAVSKWTTYAQIVDGPLFRSTNRHGKLIDAAISGQVVSLILKEAVETAGGDPTLYSSFSLTQGPNGAS